MENNTTLTKSLFDARLPPGRAMLTPKEVAGATGFSRQHILKLFDSGRIHGFSSNARAAKGSEQRYTIRIPREAAIAWMVEAANYDAEMLMDAIKELIDRLPPAGLEEIHARTASRLRK